MSRLLPHLVAGVMAVLVLTAVDAAAQTPLSIDDLLGMDSFGAASLSPDGSTLLYERRAGYETAAPFDHGHRSIWAVSEIHALDLDDKSATPRPLFEPGQGRGITLGPWSPSGKRLVLYRLAEGRLDLGLFTPGTNRLIWTGLTPDMPLTGGFVAWQDDDRLIATVRTGDRLPWILRYDGGGQAAMRENWERMARGDAPSRTIVETRGGISRPVDRDGEPQTVVQISASDGHWRPILRGRILDFALSPDSRRLAVLDAAEDIEPPAGPRQASELLSRGRLRLYGLDGADGIALISETGPEVDIAPHLLRWSSGSDKLLVWARPAGAYWEAGSLTAVSRSGDRTAFRHPMLSVVAAGRTIDSLRGVRAEWVGDTAVLHARTNGGERFDWYAVSATQPPRVLTRDLSSAPSRLAAIDGDRMVLFSGGHLWSVTPGGTLSRLSSGGEALSDAIAVDVMKPLRLEVNDTPLRSFVVAKDAAGGVITIDREGRGVLRSPDHLFGGSSVLASASCVQVGLVRDRGTETLTLTDRHGHRRIDQVNSDFRERPFTRAVPIVHRDRLDRETRSWFYPPGPSGQPDQAKGLVVMIYPGSVRDGVYLDPSSLLFGLRAELLAAAGYGVLSAALPLDSNGASPPDGAVRSIDLAVDALRQAYPGLPTGRTAILGHSFGGTTALAVAARSSRYQSYVAWSSATDLFGMWGEFQPTARSVPEESDGPQWQMGWVETGQAQIGAPPWEAQEAYIAQSPVFSAQAITSPVLLITADRDFVPMSQSERIFTVLHRQGIRSRLVSYAGEGHFNWSPANIRDLYAQVLLWLDETLTPSSPALSATGAARPASSSPSPPGA